MKKYLFLLFLVAIGFFHACERDDICAEATPTTPRIVIEFYDVANPETLKSVDDLVIIGEGQTEVFEDDNGATIRTTTSTSLPLRTTDDTTTYTFIKDAFINDNNTPDNTEDDFLDGNYDTITITYAREEVYVSRACGYKTTFINFLPEVVDDGDNWILTSLRADGITNIEDENQAHINIRH